MIVKHHLLYYLLGTAGTQNGPYGSQLVQSSPVNTNNSDYSFNCQNVIIF